MDVSPQARQDRLKRNLDVIKAVDPGLHARLAALEPSDSPQIELFPTVENAEGREWLSGRVRCEDGQQVLLASAHDPEAEARRWFAGQGDYGEQTHAVVIVGGGLGYHVAEALKHHAGGVVIVLESSLELTRAMLTCQDFTYELIARKLVLMVDVKRSEMSALTGPHRLDLMFGTLLARHPASARAGAEGLRRMLRDFTDTMAYIRSGVVTAMQISARSCDNALQNLPWYLDYPGVNHLKGCFAGSPGICVAAGPSLRGCIDQLREVQGRVPIIAVQTVLRTLLEAGIRPDFVTSLDFSEHSRRFYEGLDDVEGITLVADPKVNPIVPRSFPGPVLMFENDFLEESLAEMPTELDFIRAGATVAHLNLYLAEYMGCDPIVLLGQDLGYGDNIYYTPGTPIHEMWAVELNRFRTVEMFQWERIARFKSTLRRTEGAGGREIYTDAQMFSYLQQFEQDIAGCAAEVINCSTGGARIAGTREMPFSEFLSQRRGDQAPVEFPVSGRVADAPQRRRKAAECLRRRQKELFELRRVCERVLPMLRRMTGKLDRPQEFNALHARMDKVRRGIDDMLRPYGLVSRYAQLAEIRRVQQDSALGRRKLDEIAVRHEQLTRDIQYVGLIQDGCRKLMSLFDSALANLETAP